MIVNVKQVIVVRRDLNMRTGKIAAQAAHASMMFMMTDNGYRTVSSFGSPDQQGHYIGHLNRRLTVEEYAWLTDPESAFAKIVVGIDSEKALQELVEQAFIEGITVHKVMDAGRTEFNGVPTLTACALGPHEVSKFIGLTDHLKLL